MLSCLFRHTDYAECLKPINMNTNGNKTIQVPSITRLQSAIEEAWQQGFDVEVSKLHPLYKSNYYSSLIHRSSINRYKMYTDGNYHIFEKLNVKPKLMTEWFISLY